MTTEAGHVQAIYKMVQHFLKHRVQSVLHSADHVRMGAVMKDNNTSSKDARTLCYGGI